MQRAAYAATVAEFRLATDEEIIGALAANALFSVELPQRNAWLRTIEVLKVALADLSEGYVLLEFTIPRMGRRADAIVLSDGCVFVLEFKVGAQHVAASDLDQVMGYALDLKNFHEPSHSVPIFPILIATEAKSLGFQYEMADDSVSSTISSNSVDLHELLNRIRRDFGSASPIDALAWLNGRYRPTPTIVEAAQALYRNHRVDEISRSEAGAENLTKTAAYVSSVIETAKRDHHKAICFITGVPGSGKTLAGLNIASIRTRVADDEYAVFLSGNGPLVKVLRAALTQDQKRQVTEVSASPKVHRSADQFIQNVHHFRDESLGTEQPPTEKVVLFDEAQRAWDRDATSNFMQRKRKVSGFDQSEPEFLLSVMDRHKDWCTVVCLVGQGQEINTGEAGLGEWLKCLTDRFSHWQIHLSDRIQNEASTFGISELPTNAITNDSLHLATSIRSFRSESVSDFASAIIDGQPSKASKLAERLGRFDFLVTRDLPVARDWVRSHRRGNEQGGLLAFSNAVRLKPEGVFVKSKIDPVDWFLKDRADVRSSSYLEEAATEFDVQGLELDWACVCLDANRRVSADQTLEPKRFRGTRWQAVDDPGLRQYVLNAHRVLLTRARQGTVVFVPRGSNDDPTRKPAWYDRLYEYLLQCGVRPLN